MIIGKMHKDRFGILRADYPKRYQALGFYLEQDVQTSTAVCDSLLLLCSKVLAGELAEWSRTGNAHTLTIRRSSVLIENEFDDSAAMCEISMSEFQVALKSWRAQIEKDCQPQNFRTAMPLSSDIEGES